MVSTRTIKVRSYECDMYRHVNNAVYLNYLEYGRREFMEDAHFDFDEATRRGFGLFVTRIDIRYRRPALMDDDLEIRTTPLKRKRLGGTMHQVILRGEEVICEGEVSWASVNREGRPTPLPEDLDTSAFLPERED